MNGRVIKMHELSLCQNIIKLIKEQADKHQKKRVLTINIEVGDLAAVDFNALTFWFDVIVKGTLAEKAQLNLIKVEGNELIIKSMEAE
jgi:hydrogenase nickel incorporation protein HypA/HybF